MSRTRTAQVLVQVVAVALISTLCYADGLSDDVREKFSLPDYKDNKCHLVFPYENNLAIQFTDSFHYRNSVVPKPWGEWAGYDLKRIGDNLWEGTNRHDHYINNFNAREMTVHIRVAQDNQQHTLECRFMSDAALRNPTHNISMLSWDHKSTDDYWNYMTGNHPDSEWLKLNGNPSNSYWETDSIKSYILYVRGALQGWPQTTAWTRGAGDSSYRMHIQYWS